MGVTAICERFGDWWAVTVPEVDGGTPRPSASTRFPPRSPISCSLATGTPAAEVRVRVDARVPGDARKE